jgi:hypothetical protein
MSIIGNLKQLVSSKAKDTGPVKERVLVHENGFIVRRDGDTIEVKWREVKRVFTYKVDCWGYDVIRLAFETADLERAVHVSEDAEGFTELMQALTRVFPEIDPEWYMKVMQPAFAENLTVLLARNFET